MLYLELLGVIFVFIFYYKEMLQTNEYAENYENVNKSIAKK